MGAHARIKRERNGMRTGTVCVCGHQHQLKKWHGAPSMMKCCGKDGCECRRYEPMTTLELAAKEAHDGERTLRPDDPVA